MDSLRHRKSHFVLPSFGDIVRGVIFRPRNIDVRNALLWGVAWIIVSAILGWHLHLAPTSALGYDLFGYMPLLWHLAANVALGIIFTLPFILAALIINRRASVVETFSRLLFAHWPAVLMLMPAIAVSGERYALLNNNLSVAFDVDATAATLFALLLAVVVVWIARWAYVAFRKATQRGGYVVLMLFGVALVVAAVATEWVLQVIYATILSV